MKYSRYAILGALALVVGAAVLKYESTARKYPPIPDVQTEIGVMPGYPGVRDWGDEKSDRIDERIAYFVAQLEAAKSAEGSFPNEGRMDSLVLSGGGSDGLFSAGLLIGWSEAGSRPDFTIVTGISAGALVAPFAFLGSEYDDVLRGFIAEATTEPLAVSRYISGVLDGVGLVDNSRLARLLRRAISPEVVRAIAREHDKGRRLIVGTTNLDAQRPVHWRIDQIAKIGLDRPEETADLITRILMASASIPGAFAPQFFEVERNGDTFSEMHVDGGVTHQLIFVPLNVDFAAKLPPEIYDFARRGTIYVVRNSKLSPEHRGIDISTFEIMSRAVSTLIKFDGIADIELLRLAAVRDGFGIKVTSVPKSFAVTEDELFDPKYMKALFDLGLELGGKPDVWHIDIAPEPLSERQLARF